ncbi:MAG: hypothetical protein CMP02_06085 [Woeseiaceae bacterium]|nr:hypothetical protein [Woeseiaceae bacterium]
MLIRKKYGISITYLSLACLSIFFLLPQITGSTELNNTAKAHLKLAEIALENSNFDEVIKRYKDAVDSSSNIEILKEAAWLSKNYGFLDQSLQFAEIWVDREPDNDTALLFLVNRQLESGLILAAKKNLKEIIIKTEENPEEVLFSIYSYLSDEKPENLEKLIYSFTRIYSKSAYIRYIYAASLLENKNVEEALVQSELAIQLEPSWEKSSLLYARALLLADRTDEAINFLAYFIGDQLNPSKESRLELALAYMSSDRLEDALGQVSQILLERSAEYEAIRLMAIINFRLGDLNSARQDFDELLAQNFFRMDAVFYLARINEQESNITEAIKLYSQVTSGVNAIYSQNKVVQLLLSMNKVDEAKNHLKNFGKTHPKYMQRAMMLEMSLHQQLGEYESVLTLSEKLLSYNPHNNSVASIRANILLELDQVSEAIDAFAQLAKNSPRDPLILNAYGYVLTNHSNDFKKAEKLIKKAIKLDPENPAIIDSYGWGLFRLGEYDSALKELVKAYDLYKDPEIAAHIIEVLLVLDRKKEAKIRLTEAQNLFINNKYLENVSERFFE